MRTIEYTEVQRVDSIWPLAILTITLVFNWFLYFVQGYQDMDLFYGSMFSIAIICTFFALVRLDTKINNESVRYKLFPFHWKWRNINWRDIEKSEIRTYKPLKEYGGWGLQFGKSGNACTIKGNEGLQIYIKNGKKILIGTNNATALEEVLAKIKNSGTIKF